MNQKEYVSKLSGIKTEDIEAIKKLKMLTESYITCVASITNVEKSIINNLSKIIIGDDGV